MTEKKNPTSPNFQKEEAKQRDPCLYRLNLIAEQADLRFKRDQVPVVTDKDKKPVMLQDLLNAEENQEPIQEALRTIDVKAISTEWLLYKTTKALLEEQGATLDPEWAKQPEVWRVLKPLFSDLLFQLQLLKTPRAFDEASQSIKQEKK